MVVAMTSRHFADLTAATGLADTFGELERLLGADFAADADRYEHREVIASLLAPWFARRSLAEIGQELDGTSVLWSRYRGFADLVSDGELAGNSLLREIDQPGVGRILSAASPLDQDGRLGPSPASRLGADTPDVLAGLLGLSDREIRALAERGVIGNDMIGDGAS
jgi:2-methylfumaryl-CoA isomerase